MADTKISVQEALEVTTRAIKEYTDGNTILSSQEQNLNENEKTIAKNNVGIYVQHAEPTEADDGDIWISPESWENQSGNIGNISIDKTLTQEGHAADAKAVGDALEGKQPVGDYALVNEIPVIPDWAKNSSKPSYTAEEVSADPAGTANSVVMDHDSDASSHQDIRDAIAEMSSNITERLVVTADMSTDSSGTASHISTQIIEHLNAGGDVVLKLMPTGIYIELMGVVDTQVIFNKIDVTTNTVIECAYLIDENANVVVSEEIISVESITQEVLSRIVDGNEVAY